MMLMRLAKIRSGQVGSVDWNEAEVQPIRSGEIEDVFVGMGEIEYVDYRRLEKRAINYYLRKEKDCKEECKECGGEEEERRRKSEGEGKVERRGGGRERGEGTVGEGRGEEERKVEGREEVGGGRRKRRGRREWRRGMRRERRIRKRRRSHQWL